MGILPLGMLAVMYVFLSLLVAGLLWLSQSELVVAITCAFRSSTITGHVHADNGLILLLSKLQRAAEK